MNLSFDWLVGWLVWFGLVWFGLVWFGLVWGFFGLNLISSQHCAQPWSSSLIIPVFFLLLWWTPRPKAAKREYVYFSLKFHNTGRHWRKFREWSKGKNWTRSCGRVLLTAVHLIAWSACCPIQLVTEAAPSPVTSPGPSQCQASTFLHNLFRFSKPVLPERPLDLLPTSGPQLLCALSEETFP